MLARALAAVVLLAGRPAAAEEEAAPSGWDAYQAAHWLDCVGPLESMPAPEIKTHEGFEYTFSGSVAKVRRLAGRAVPGEVRLGVISGIKELDPDTRVVLTTFFEKFRSSQVEGIIVGGDSAEDESHLEEVLAFLAGWKLPTYVVIGNWESRAPFNRALRALSREHPNLINLDLVRRLDAEGFDLVSLAGYLDRAYVKTSGSCVYKPEEVESIVALAKHADDPVVLLTHGPPRQSGKEAIDFVPGVGNVGDEALAGAIARAKIPFGVHGHILEAGARATDLKGKPLAPGKLWPALFLNPGPANVFPWKLNSGRTARGLAVVLRIKGTRAAYEVLVPERRAP